MLLIPHVKFSLVLLLILILWYSILAANKFVLNKVMGAIFIVFYAIFLVYAFVQDKVCDYDC